MPFTLSCSDAYGWNDLDPMKPLALGLCGTLRVPGTPIYEDSNQHDYGDFTNEQIDALFGPILTRESSLGVFLDLEAGWRDGVYVYGFPRFAAGIASRYPGFTGRFRGVQHIVNAIDNGTVPTKGDEYPLARLVGNILNLADNPVAGLPCVVILW